MSANAAFKKKPHYFLSTNIVLATGMGATQPRVSENLYWVTLVEGWAPQPMPPYKPMPANGKNQTDGKKCKVYYLRCLCDHGQTPAVKDAFAIYWVPYQPDGLKQAMLGTTVPYMFTAKMDGCTFGLGSVNADGSVLAAHANRAKVGGSSGWQAQLAQQKTDLQDADAATHLLESGTYRRWDEALGRWMGEATTFGLFYEDHWTVYALRFEKEGHNPPTFIHKGIKTAFHAV